MKIRHYHVRVLWQRLVLKADNVDALCIICVIEFIQQCLQSHCIILSVVF